MAPCLFPYSFWVLNFLRCLYNLPNYKSFYAHNNCPRVNHLTFADDSIIFCNGSKNSIQLIIDTLSRYEKISGKLINKNKSSFSLKSKVSLSVINKTKRYTGMRFQNSPSDTWDALWSLITRRKFGEANIGETWRSLSNIFDANIHQHISNPVKWIKPPARTFKLNSDGSFLQGSCGGGGLIRDSFGHTIFAYSINLGLGTSNMAEAAALLYGLKWCADKGLTNVWW